MSSRKASSTSSEVPAVPSLLGIDMKRNQAWNARLVGRIGVALVAGELVTSAHEARAQGADAPTQDDAATRDAKARFEEGLKRYEAQDFEGARVAFQQAYSVLPAVDILYNLALSELRSNRPVEALH